MKPLKNILDTARDLGAGKFVTYIEESGLSSELTKEGTYTLFAPLDDAFNVSYLLHLQGFAKCSKNNRIIYTRNLLSPMRIIVEQP